MKILLSQELFRNCLHILNSSVEHETEAIQLLDLIVESKWKDLGIDEKQEIQESVMRVLKKRVLDPVALQVAHKINLLNGSWSFDGSDVVLMMARNLHSLQGPSPITNEDVLRFSIKLLTTSLHDEKNIAGYIGFLVEHEYKLADLINITTSNPKYFNILKDLLRLTAVLCNSQHPSVAQYLAVAPLEDLKIQNFFEF